jgi:hypothetical protein
MTLASPNPHDKSAIPIATAASTAAAITHAPNVEAVVKLADDYVRSVPASAWTGLPDAFRPQRIFSREDVTHWAVRLAAFGSNATALDARNFLLAASARLTQIRADATTPRTHVR